MVTALEVTVPTDIDTELETDAVIAEAEDAIEGAGGAFRDPVVVAEADIAPVGPVNKATAAILNS